MDSQQGVFLQLGVLLRSLQLTLKLHHIRNCYTILYHTFLLNQLSCWMASRCHATKHLTIRVYSGAEIHSGPHILELCKICSWAVNFILLQGNRLNGLRKPMHTACMLGQKLLLKRVFCVAICMVRRSLHWLGLWHHQVWCMVINVWLEHATSIVIIFIG